MSAIQQMLLAGGATKYALPTYTNIISTSSTSASFVVGAISGAVAGDICLLFTYTNASQAFASTYSNILQGAVSVGWLRLSGADSATTVSVVGHSAGVFTRAAKVLVRGAYLDGVPIASNTLGATYGTTFNLGTGGDPGVGNTLFVGGGGCLTTAGSMGVTGWVGTGKTNVAVRSGESFGVSGGTGYFAVVTADCIDATAGGSLLGTASQTISSGSAVGVRIKGRPV